MTTKYKIFWLGEWCGEAWESGRGVEIDAPDWDVLLIKKIKKAVRFLNSYGI